MKAWRDLRALPRPVWVLFWATLVNRAGTMALPFLVLYLTEHEGFTPGQAGSVMALYGAGALVAGPVAGRVSDRLGPARLMRAALLGAGLLQLAVPLVHGQVALSLVCTLWAVASEAYRPASQAVVAEVAAEHRKQAFALIRMAINLGMSLGPALGGLLAKAHFASLFVVDGLTTLGAAAVLAWALPVGAPPARATPAPGDAPPSRWGPLADPRMRTFWLGSVAVATVFFQADSAMPLHLVHNIGLSETTYGLLFTINTVLIVLLEIPLTAAIAHWDTRRTLALGALLVAAGFGLLGLAHDVWGVAATVLVWTLGEMLYSPSSSAYAAELAPPDQRGAYLGLYTAAWSVAFTLAPALGTRGLERLGALHWAVVFAVGALGTGLMLAGAAPRTVTESAPG